MTIIVGVAVFAVWRFRRAWQAAWAEDAAAWDQYTTREHASEVT